MSSEHEQATRGKTVEHESMFHGTMAVFTVIRL